LAKHLGCNDDELNTLYFAGLMHDIGKIGIDDAVLRKPGQLTPEEFDLIKLHPQLGHDILAGVKQLEHLLPIVLHHHENWNGKGYPMGLAGNDCPKLARIAAVADAFDAMSSDRPYRKGMDDDKLHEILRSGAGKQWDPVVVAAFFEAREEIRQIVDEANAELTPLTAAPRSSTKFESTKFESPAWHATSCPAKT
jgi:HD-GYP domain-containing protein (c-di-GMP phosphodiesterase class II)